MWQRAKYHLQAMLKTNTAAHAPHQYAMKGNLKSVAILIAITGLILISGFIATQILLFESYSGESSVGGNVNAISTDASGDRNANNPGVSPSTSSFSADHQGVSAGNPKVMVWVNTSSGVYHCPNTRWYGNTKNGKYMTQQEAQAKGYRPAYGSVCG